MCAYAHKLQTSIPSKLSAYNILVTEKVIQTTIEDKDDSREIKEQDSILYLKKGEELQNITNNLPSNLGIGLMLAIIGHSFWNGSSFFVEYLFIKNTTNVVYSALGSLLWIMVLISGLLLVGRFIVQNVKLLPDKMV